MRLRFTSWLTNRILVQVFAWRTCSYLYKSMRYIFTNKERFLIFINQCGTSSPIKNVFLSLLINAVHVQTGGRFAIFLNKCDTCKWTLYNIRRYSLIDEYICMWHTYRSHCTIMPAL